MNTETAYWMALAHELPAWSFSDKEAWKNEDKLNLIIQFHHDKKMSITDFFELSDEDLKNDFQLNDRRIADLHLAKSSLPNYAFIAENLQNSGIEVIPVISPDYSKTLKNNLKKSVPPVLYIKGNKKILQENSVAIVGSRAASEVALDFTDNIARKVSKEWKVVVSGFAKGVDKQALDSAIACKGQSIIVLPQGILTFATGFKTYYKQIIEGDVLVLSTFHPQAGWGKDLAMARNSIIYGLASEIYVAESKPSRNRQGKETKGGTYSGVMDGLKKGRKIYVRKPELTEKNDNNILIQSGAIPIDFEGNILTKPEVAVEQTLVFAQPDADYETFEKQIRRILQHGQMTASEILKHTKSDWTATKMTNELKKLDFIAVKKEKNRNYFSIKGQSELTLFD